MNPPLLPDELEALRRLDACLLANTVETFHRRPRNEGFMDGSIRCLFPQLPAIIGYAATVTIRGSAPPVAGRPFLDRTDWWNYIATLPAPRVVVVQDLAERPGLGSLVGAVHMNILRALQVAGVVTNGSVRDIPAAETARFQLFAGNVAVSHAYVHIVEFGAPVRVAGLTVNSADLLHGDRHGVQSIPPELVREIPAAAAAMAAREQTLIALCRSADFSLEKLRAAVTDYHP